MLELFLKSKMTETNKQRISINEYAPETRSKIIRLMQQDIKTSNMIELYNLVFNHDKEKYPDKAHNRGKIIVGFAVGSQWINRIKDEECAELIDSKYRILDLYKNYPEFVLAEVEKKEKEDADNEKKEKEDADNDE